MLYEAVKEQLLISYSYSIVTK